MVQNAEDSEWRSYSLILCTKHEKIVFFFQKRYSTYTRQHLRHRELRDYTFTFALNSRKTYFVLRQNECRSHPSLHINLSLAQSKSFWTSRLLHEMCRKKIIIFDIRQLQRELQRQSPLTIKHSQREENNEKNKGKERMPGTFLRIIAFILN